MSKIWEKIFFVFSFITQGSSYLSPYAYGVLHRMHHAYADTKKDPHSPKYDNTLLKMMIRTKDIYTNIFYRRIEIDNKFTDGVPQWNPFDKFAHKWGVRIAWMLAYTVFYYFFATEWWMFLLLPIHFLMGPLHGAIINWFAHKYGYVNFKVGNTSKNFLPVDFLMFGESYHNNHHKFGTKPNFGYKWFELDPAYFIILFMNLVGIVRLKK